MKLLLLIGRSLGGCGSSRGLLRLQLARVSVAVSLTSGEAARLCRMGDQLAAVFMLSLALTSEGMVADASTMAGMMVPFLREYWFLQAGHCMVAEDLALALLELE